VRTIVVTAAVIERGDRFLVTRRQKGVHLEGHWEFPGGKCDPGETLGACVGRELREELRVETKVGDELFSTTHDYGDRLVELHFLLCEISGEPAPQQGQEMRWVTHGELGTLRFPAADQKLIEILARRR
jgi:mutator protein MutT